MSDSLEIDQARVEALSYQMLVAIRENFIRGPESRARVSEALNALAGSAAVVIKGAGDPRAAEFFRAALEKNLAELAVGGGT